MPRRLLTVLTLLVVTALPGQGQDAAPPDFIPVDRQPVPLHQVQPAYPDEARQALLEGRVMIRLWVGTDGRVREAQLFQSDNPLFDEPALAAVRQWTFEPAMKDGRPVAVWIMLPVRFRIRRPDAMEGTWHDATRTFATDRFSIRLPEGFGRPRQMTQQQEAGPISAYVSTSGQAAFLIMEPEADPGTRPDTSHHGMRELLGVLHTRLLDGGATFLAPPEERLSSEALASRLSVKLQKPGQPAAYGFAEIVLPRRASRPPFLIMYLSPAPGLPGQEVRQALDTFQALDPVR